MSFDLPPVRFFQILYRRFRQPPGVFHLCCLGLAGKQRLFAGLPHCEDVVDRAGRNVAFREYFANVFLGHLGGCEIEPDGEITLQRLEQFVIKCTRVAAVDELCRAGKTFAVDFGAGAGGMIPNERNYFGCMASCKNFMFNSKPSILFQPSVNAGGCRADALSAVPPSRKFCSAIRNNSLM